MSDLIKRQDAIDAVQKAIINHDSAIERIVNLPSAQQWIPVSERLPEEPKPNKELEGKPLDIYLVCKSGNIPFRAFWNGKFFTDGWTTLDVDAWMPLPEPYKGVEE